MLTAWLTDTRPCVAGVLRAQGNLLYAALADSPWWGRRRTQALLVGVAGLSLLVGPIGAASVASSLAAVLTEIYLCNVCSCQEILRRNGRG
jgi:hypothetical protein